jgi:hypothetical protein
MAKEKLDYKKLYNEALLASDVYQQVNDKLGKDVKSKNETIEDLEARLDIAFREQEQMLEELKKWTKAFPYAFKQLVEHAGEITPEDVEYHISLLNRIMEHKFAYKPTED